MEVDCLQEIRDLFSRSDGFDHSLMKMLTREKPIRVKKRDRVKKYGLFEEPRCLWHPSCAKSPTHQYFGNSIDNDVPRKMYLVAPVVLLLDELIEIPKITPSNDTSPSPFSAAQALQFLWCFARYKQLLPPEPKGLGVLPLDQEFALESAMGDEVLCSQDDIRLKVDIMRHFAMVGASGKRKKKKMGPKKRGRARTNGPQRGPRQKTGVFREGMDVRGIGQQTKVWLQAVDPTKTRLVSVGALFNAYEYHINDIWKFDPAVTTMIFTGTAAFNAFYNQYLVLGARISWMVGNLDPNYKQVYLMPGPNPIAATVTSVATADQLSGNLKCPLPKILSPTLGGQSRVVMNVRIPNMAQFSGNPTDYRANYAGVVGQSPASFMYLAMAATVGATGSNALGVFNDLRVELKVEFFDRKILLN